MQNPFRKYKVIMDWTDKDSFTKESCTSVINLFYVRGYDSCNNAYYEFKDSVKRTVICMANGDTLKARVSFDEFEVIMDNFLTEAKLLDDRSMRPKKKEVDLPAKATYRGPMSCYFFQFKDKIVCTCYPDGVYPTNFEEGMMNTLYSAVIPFN